MPIDYKQKLKDFINEKGYKPDAKSFVDYLKPNISEFSDQSSVYDQSENILQKDDTDKKSAYNILPELNIGDKNDAVSSILDNDFRMKGVNEETSQNPESPVLTQSTPQAVAPKAKPPGTGGKEGKPSQAAASQGEKDLASVKADLQNTKDAMTDEEFQRASDKAREDRFSAMLGKIGSQMGNALTDYGTGSIQKHDLSTQDELVKSAYSPVTELEEQRKQMQEKLKLATESEMRDPNSAISQMSRNMFEVYTGKKAAPGATAASLEKALVLGEKKYAVDQAKQARIDAAKAAADAKKTEQEQKQNEKLYSAQQRIMNHTIFKESTEAINNASKAKQQVDLAVHGNGQALAAIGATVARIAGEKGVLSAEDVKRYVQDPTVAGKLMSSYDRLVNGKLKKEDANNINRLLDISVQAEKQRLGNFISGQVRSYKSSVGGDEEKIRSVFDPEGYTSQQTKQQPRAKTVVQNGHTYTWNEATGKYE